MCFCFVWPSSAGGRGGFPKGEFRMSRSTDLKIKIALAITLLLAPACDTSSLVPFAAPASKASTPSGPDQFPGPGTFGTAVAFRPSAVGWIAFVNQNNLWLIHPDGSGIKQITRNPVPSDA